MDLPKLQLATDLTYIAEDVGFSDVIASAGSVLGPLQVALTDSEGRRCSYTISWEHGGRWGDRRPSPLNFSDEAEQLIRACWQIDWSDPFTSFYDHLRPIAENNIWCEEVEPDSIKVIYASRYSFDGPYYSITANGVLDRIRSCVRADNDEISGLLNAAGYRVSQFLHGDRPDGKTLKVLVAGEDGAIHELTCEQKYGLSMFPAMGDCLSTPYLRVALRRLLRAFIELDWNDPVASLAYHGGQSFNFVRKHGISTYTMSIEADHDGDSYRRSHVAIDATIRLDSASYRNFQKERAERIENEQRARARAEKEAALEAERRAAEEETVREARKRAAVLVARVAQMVVDRDSLHEARKRAAAQVARVAQTVINGESLYEAKKVVDAQNISTPQSTDGGQSIQFEVRLEDLLAAYGSRDFTCRRIERRLAEDRRKRAEREARERAKEEAAREAEARERAAKVRETEERQRRLAARIPSGGGNYIFEYDRSARLVSDEGIEFAEELIQIGSGCGFRNIEIRFICEPYSIEFRAIDLEGECCVYSLSVDGSDYQRNHLDIGDHLDTLGRIISVLSHINWEDPLTSIDALLEKQDMTFEGASGEEESLAFTCMKTFSVSYFVRMMYNVWDRIRKGAETADKRLLAPLLEAGYSTVFPIDGRKDSLITLIAEKAETGQFTLTYEDNSAARTGSLTSHGEICPIPGLRDAMAGLICVFVDTDWRNPVESMEGAMRAHGLGNLVVEKYGLSRYVAVDWKGRKYSIKLNRDAYEFVEGQIAERAERERKAAARDAELEKQAERQLATLGTTLDAHDLETMDGHEFELFCAKLLEANGYKNVEVTRGSGDQGIDVIATRDKVRFGIQCKRYSGEVGNSAIREAHAGKSFYKCQVGIVLTNSSFTKAAVEAADRLGIVLWDGDDLKRMIVAANMARIS